MSRKNNIYCIILTRFRLLQGVALCRSLIRHAGSPYIYILCMDDETYNVLDKIKLNNVLLLRLVHIEDNRLKEVKRTRKLNEYCWTIKPFLIDYVFNNSIIKPGNVTYLDADLYFFSNPERIFQDTPYCSVLLTKHNYSPDIEYLANICGTYNSGFISFRNCPSAIKCIKWWEIKCLEWCYEIFDSKRFGDQKYLDFMPNYFRGACAVKTPGVNIAPWNHLNYRFKRKDEMVFVDDEPLIFYHFSGFRIINKDEAALIFGYDKNIIPLVHLPYMSELKKIIDEIESLGFCINDYFMEGTYTKDVTIIGLNEDKFR